MSASRYGSVGGTGRPLVTVPELPDADIERILFIRAGLLERWAMIDPGHTMELEFTRSRNTRT